MNIIDLQRDESYPDAAEMRGLVRSLGPTTLFDLFESHAVSEEDRFDLIEEALALLIVEGRREADLSERFLETLEARCRTQAAARAAEDGNGAERSGFELIGRVEYLCRASQDEVFRDSRRAVGLAELAVELADRIDPKICGEAATAEQRILARVWLGNARRVDSDLQGAERAFSNVLASPDCERIPVLARAQLWNLLASLRSDQGRYDEAIQALEVTRSVYSRLGMDVDELTIEIKLSDSEGLSGRPEDAVRRLLGVIDEVDRLPDQRLRLVFHHNLMTWMVEAGHISEAAERFEAARPLYDASDQEPRLRYRRRWLEGRLLVARGHLETAREAFDDVRSETMRSRSSYSCATVTLELALVHLRLGNLNRVGELAEEMIAFFRSQDLHHYLFAAMDLFHRAAVAETATVGLVEEMLRYFRRSWTNPQSRFEPPEPSAGS